MIHTTFSACQGSALTALMRDHGNFGILSHRVRWPSRALKDRRLGGERSRVQNCYFSFASWSGFPAPLLLRTSWFYRSHVPFLSTLDVLLFGRAAWLMNKHLLQSCLWSMIEKQEFFSDTKWALKNMKVREDVSLIYSIISSKNRFFELMML